MGRKGRQMRCAAKVMKDEPVAPTPEQMRSGRFDIEDTHDKLPGGKQITIGKAYRRRPMIDTLADQGLFSEREFKALSFYRHCATIADKSPVKDSLDRQRYGGTGNGPTAAYLTACEVVRDCERAAGSLADILRAVAVDDISISDWAMKQAGAVEQCRDRKGKLVCRLEPRQGALRIAQLEIKIAAQRVEGELGG